MKYLRVVIAVEDDYDDIVVADLDELIEDHEYITGAYVGGLYENRTDAIGTDWKEYHQR
jgi:hypothetical protein